MFPSQSPIPRYQAPNYAVVETPLIGYTYLLTNNKIMTTELLAERVKYFYSLKFLLFYFCKTLRHRNTLVTPLFTSKLRTLHSEHFKTSSSIFMTNTRQKQLTFYTRVNEFRTRNKLFSMRSIYVDTRTAAHPKHARRVDQVANSRRVRKVASSSPHFCSTPPDLGTKCFCTPP